MHILILASEYPTTYSQFTGIFYKDQAEALAKENFVGVIAIVPIGLKVIAKTWKFNFTNRNYSENNVCTYHCQYPNIFRIISWNNQFKLKLFKQIFKKYISEHGLPDIVHLHSFGAGILALWIKRRQKIPYVVTEHSSGFSRGLISKKERLLTEKVYTNSSCNIAVSLKFAEMLEKEFKQPFIYIPNIIPSIFFIDDKQINKHERTYFHFINVAFLDKNKNQALLVQAFRHAFGKNSNFRLTIVGSGSEYNYLKELIENLGLSDCVTLFGQADRLEVKEVLLNSDAFVLSSKYETFGVVLIEAMACGLPVVSTRCGGPESIVTNEKLGILCGIDYLSLSEALVKITKRKFDKEYIRNYVFENFSGEAISRQLIQVYEKANIRI